MTDQTFNSIDLSTTVLESIDPREKLEQENVKDSKASLLYTFSVWDKAQKFTLTKRLSEVNWVVSPSILPLDNREWESWLKKNPSQLSSAAIKEFSRKDNHFFDKDYVLGGVPNQPRNELRKLYKSKQWLSCTLLAYSLIDARLVEIAGLDPTDRNAEYEKINKASAQMYRLKDNEVTWAAFNAQSIIKWIDLNMKPSGVGKFRNSLAHGQFPLVITKVEATQALSALIRLIRIGQASWNSSNR